MIISSPQLIVNITCLWYGARFCNHHTMSASKHFIQRIPLIRLFLFKLQFYAVLCTLFTIPFNRVAYCVTFRCYMKKKTSNKQVVKHNRKFLSFRIEKIIPTSRLHMLVDNTFRLLAMNEWWLRPVSASDDFFIVFIKNIFPSVRIKWY